MKISNLKGLLAATIVVAGLSACHCSANDNTSRAAQNDEHGRNVGNSEIEKNFTPGSDCNPNNDMWDGISGNLHGNSEGEGGGPGEHNNEGDKDHQEEHGHGH
jgi:hypothetical protein